MAGNDERCAQCESYARLECKSVGRALYREVAGMGTSWGSQNRACSESPTIRPEPGATPPNPRPKPVQKLRTAFNTKRHFGGRR
jgi:hypothetical protein